MRSVGRVGCVWVQDGAADLHTEIVSPACSCSRASSISSSVKGSMALGAPGVGGRVGVRAEVKGSMALGAPDNS